MMYEYTDKVIAKLDRVIAREFSNAKRTVLAFDEVNVIRKAVNECYGTILTATKKAYRDIARHAYKAAGGDTVDVILLVDLVLKEYDPVTRYMFNTEYDRKRARAFENAVATRSPADMNTAARLLANQIHQYADEVTDAATVRAYKDTGVDLVQWVAEHDDRTCTECDDRDGTVYPIDKVPDKPHIRCRCQLRPYKRP